MDAKAADYSEPLIKLSSGSKKVHELFQKNQNTEAVKTIDDMICELILLKNWAKFKENAS